LLLLAKQQQQKIVILLLSAKQQQQKIVILSTISVCYAWALIGTQYKCFIFVVLKNI
jgi:hypothetical protein